VVNSAFFIPRTDRADDRSAGAGICDHNSGRNTESIANSRATKDQRRFRFVTGRHAFVEQFAGGK
jgi:hypothetical protein